MNVESLAETVYGFFFFSGSEKKEGRPDLPSCTYFIPFCLSLSRDPILTISQVLGLQRPLGSSTEAHNVADCGSSPFGCDVWA